jgi:hypothetical protein
MCKGNARGHLAKWAGLQPQGFGVGQEAGRTLLHTAFLSGAVSCHLRVPSPMVLGASLEHCGQCLQQGGGILCVDRTSMESVLRLY